MSKLWKKFLEIAKPNEDGYSREVTMEELISIDESFRTNNGCQWARQDTGPSAEYNLVKRYGVDGNKKNGPVYSIKLNGFNRNYLDKHIRADIKDEITKQRCSILDTGGDKRKIECDHKDGKHADKRISNLESQKLEDFQPLSKAANVAKREHCKKCIETGKRYDAKRLGYKESFLYGNEDSPNCEGCYWYDPKKFNSVISKDYVKNV